MTPPRLLIAMICLTLMSSAAVADVINVPADYPTIQEAIDASSDGDEIVVAPGTYTSTHPAHVVDLKGKAIDLRSSGGPNVTFIDGQSSKRGIACFREETNQTSITGFTVKNGFGANYDYTQGEVPVSCCSGGGMVCFQSSPVVSNCVFAHNNSESGGGIFCAINSSPIFSECVITNNNATVNGGGIKTIRSSPEFNDCVINENFVTPYQYGGGSAFYCEDESTLLLYNCVLSNNVTGGYATVNCVQSDLMATNCILDSNYSGQSASAIRLWNSANTELTGCVINNQQRPENGGTLPAVGLVCSGSTFALIDRCIFSNNLNGGLSSQISSEPTLSNTIFCNSGPHPIEGNWIDAGGNEILDNCGNLDGACCVEEACYEVEQLFCDATDGTWLGYNVTCEAETCAPQPQFGACCVNGEALPLFDYDCDLISGWFAGEGTSPVDVTCPDSCLGDANFDGTVDVNDILDVVAQFGVTCP